jgi:hypothetical protein
MVAFLAFPQEQQYFSVRRTKAAYPSPNKALQALAEAKGTKNVNRFCVVGYQKSVDDKQKYAWVYWREQNAMVLWESWVKPQYTESSLTDSRRYLDLSKDVVDSESDLHGSTYLVTAQWVNRIKIDCARHGDQFVIVKRWRR